VTVLDQHLYPGPLEQGYPTDAGLDLRIRTGSACGALETFSAPLGVAVSVPSGQFGMIVPRSSAARAGFLTPPVLIDPGYDGEVHAFLTCTRPHVYTRGEELVSLIIVAMPRHPGGLPRKQGQRGSNANGSSTKG
jgi:dUTPase